MVSFAVPRIYLTAAITESRALRKELREREKKSVTELLENAQVVLCTCTGAGGSVLKVVHKSSSQNCQFDVVVIDEAAQSMEIACWIPILRAKKVSFPTRSPPRSS
jgi:superfamily I DNA and/or RNA helicase